MIRLQLGDAFHGPDLGRARDGPRGEARAERVQGVESRRELSFDDRGEVHDVREAVDAHELLHADRPRARDAPDVVAREVDEHDVLRPLLLGGTQLGLVRSVLRPVLAAWARSGDRVHDHLPALDAHERLW